MLFGVAPPYLHGLLRQLRRAILLDERKQGGQLLQRGLNIKLLVEWRVAIQRRTRP